MGGRSNKEDAMTDSDLMRLLEEHYAGPYRRQLKKIGDHFQCPPQADQIIARCQILKMERDTAHMDALADYRKEMKQD